MQGNSEKLARDRTDLARQRNLLANERTFSAWLRTGLSAVVAGLGIARLLDPGGLLPIAHSIGVILVLTGGGIYVLAFWRYGQVSRSLEQENMRAIPTRLLNILLAALLLSGVLAFVLLFQR
jgi:putative membrane protein